MAANPTRALGGAGVPWTRLYAPYGRRKPSGQPRAWMDVPALAGSTPILARAKGSPVPATTDLHHAACASQCAAHSCLASKPMPCSHSHRVSKPVYTMQVLSSAPADIPIVESCESHQKSHVFLSS